MARSGAIATCRSTLSTLVVIFYISITILLKSSSVISARVQDHISNVTRTGSSEGEDDADYVRVSHRHPHTLGAGRSLQSKYVHEVVGLRMDASNYRGIRARFPVWNPKLEDESTQRSYAFMAVVTADSQITVGWEVDPGRHGDTDTHLFVLTKNATHSWFNEVADRCFRLRKPLPLPNKDEAPQFELEWSRREWTFSIDRQLIGTWPVECLPAMEKGGLNVLWGGGVTYFSSSTSPSTVAEMGSGIRPNPDIHFDGSAFISNVEYMWHKKGGYMAPDTQGKLHLGKAAANDDCYCAYGSPSNPQLHPELGYVVYYGGPMENILRSDLDQQNSARR